MARVVLPRPPVPKIDTTLSCFSSLIIQPVISCRGPSMPTRFLASSYSVGARGSKGTCAGMVICGSMLYRLCRSLSSTIWVLSSWISFAICR
uniref:Uncharacterized protein n=1 Tax=Arundo donax TaxID=35708 RepID=A0A0A9AV59_ARUDO